MSLKSLVIEKMPTFLMGFFARPYMGGYSVLEALATAKRLQEEKSILSTIDVLGEEVRTREKSFYNKDLYLRLLKAVLDAGYTEEDRPSVSIKLSSLTRVENHPERVEIDGPLLEENLREILEYGREKSLKITIDMEDHRWTSLTLEQYKRFFEEGHTNLGTVLQTRLHRTEKDIEELPPRCRVRLCIGIYTEPSEIALIDKREMKDRLVSWGKKLLEKEIFTELATHDIEAIQKFLGEVYQPGKHRDLFEIQMLLGVPRDKLQGDLIRGSYGESAGSFKVRLYVPFAENRQDALAYCRRRLLANPSLISYGMYNFFRRLW